MAKDELEEYNLNLERKEEAMRLYKSSKSSKNKMVPPPMDSDSKLSSGHQLGPSKHFSNHHVVNLMKCLVEEPGHPKPDFQNEVELEF